MPWLTPFEGEAIEPFEEYDGLEFTGLDLGAARAGNTKFSECRLRRVTFEHGSLARGLVADSEIAECRFVATDLSDVEWRDIRVDGSLIAGGTFIGSRLLRVTFADAKLTGVNLRGARLSEVTFERCLLSDVDLAEATVSRVRFADCTISGLDVTKTRFEKTDFRSSTLQISRGLLSLRGTRMDVDQLFAIAPAIAADIGIAIG